MHRLGGRLLRLGNLCQGRGHRLVVGCLVGLECLVVASFRSLVGHIEEQEEPQRRIEVERGVAGVVREGSPIAIVGW